MGRGSDKGLYRNLDSDSGRYSVDDSHFDLYRTEAPNVGVTGIPAEVTTDCRVAIVRCRAVGRGGGVPVQGFPASGPGHEVPASVRAAEAR